MTDILNKEGYDVQVDLLQPRKDGALGSALAVKPSTGLVEFNHWATIGALPAKCRQTTDMKTATRWILVLAVTVWSTAYSAGLYPAVGFSPATGEIVSLKERSERPPEEKALSRIQMVNVPLADAIRTLARESNLNYILDPHVPGSDFGPGRLSPKLSVTASWTNVTAPAALSALLKEHGLTMVNNPATTVTRIAPANLSVKPVPTSQVGTNTSSIIPLLVMDSVSLTEAVTQLARSASLAVSLDPKLSATAFDAPGTVSFRWERIMARQALAALLDNYDLVMIEDRATSAARITQKSDPENERDVAVKKAKVWLTKNPALLKPGAAKSTNAPAFGPVTERATASAADEAAWGEPVEGVSVRLRADKIKWATNEIPTFKLDVRNQGQREFYTVQSQESGRLEVDGVWYDWTGPIDLKGSSLPPGREYHDIPVSLGSNWKATQEWRDKTQAPPPQIPLKLLPGKHTIRFAPEIRDITVKPKPQSNYVPSNPAEIEIISK